MEVDGPPGRGSELREIQAEALEQGSAPFSETQPLVPEVQYLDAELEMPRPTFACTDFGAHVDANRQDDRFPEEIHFMQQQPLP